MQPVRLREARPAARSTSEQGSNPETWTPHGWQYSKDAANARGQSATFRQKLSFLSSSSARHLPGANDLTAIPAIAKAVFREDWGISRSPLPGTMKQPGRFGIDDHVPEEDCQLADTLSGTKPIAVNIPTEMPRLKGYGFPREVVAHAVWAYHRFALSRAEVYSYQTPTQAPLPKQVGNPERPFLSPRMYHTSLRRVQRQTFPQQGFGDLFASQHKMQVGQRRTRQKRHIFRGFSPRRGDPGRQPGY